MDPAQHDQLAARVVLLVARDRFELTGCFDAVDFFDVLCRPVEGRAAAADLASSGPRNRPV